MRSDLPGDRLPSLLMYRMIYIGLGALVVAIIALTVVFAPSGDTPELPSPIESVSPSPEDQAMLQAEVVVDLEPGHIAEIVVDGFPVSANYMQGPAIYRWSPSPHDPSISSWTTGEHTVVVNWEKVSGVPEFGTYTWTFEIR